MSKTLTIEEIFKDYGLRYLPTANEYRMTCVFRENHTLASDGSGSLVVSPEKNAYHCFSCSAHGSLVKLLTGKMKVSFFDALELVTLNNIDHIFAEEKKKEVFETDFILNLKAPAALVSRGFSPRALKRHRVSTLDKFNKKLGKTAEHMAIPWFSEKRLIGIKIRIGRDFYWVPNKFEKSKYLYNYDAVKERFNSVYIVEGETDVYQVEKNGNMNVVATGGGGFSEEQAALCKQFDHVFLAFDNDEAGLKNIEIANALLSKYTRNIYVLNYESKDPGSCSYEEWKNAVKEPQTYIEYSMSMAVELGDDYLNKKKKWLKNY